MSVLRISSKQGSKPFDVHLDFLNVVGLAGSSSCPLTRDEDDQEVTYGQQLEIGISPVSLIELTP